MNISSKIYVAGGYGMAGSAIIRKLKEQGYNNIIVTSHKELDLTRQDLTHDFFFNEKPQYVFMAAALVGGIKDNNEHKADFIYKNLMIQNNIINASKVQGVKKLLFLGSSCIYPKNSPQPIKECYLLSGLLEPTNDAYAIAKIAGIKMCQTYREQYGCDFISVIPCNLYGPGDKYDLNKSHVIPALILKMYEAIKNSQSSVSIWGSGEPYREFMHVDDLAEACIFLMNNYSDIEPINVGTGSDIQIKDLAERLKSISGFEGQLVYDSTQPDGTPRKLLDTSCINGMGWQHSIDLRNGLKRVYEDKKAEWDAAN